MSQRVSRRLALLGIGGGAAAVPAAAAGQPAAAPDSAFVAGLFTERADLRLPAGVRALRTTGYLWPGKGAAHYVRDLSQAPGEQSPARAQWGGVWFRLSPDQWLVDTQFGVAADGIQDDAAATNAFLAFVTAKGGYATLTPGPRMFGSQVILERAQPTTLVLQAAGVVIKTQPGQPISGFKINGAWPPFSTTICGLTIEDANPRAIAGFEQTGTGHVNWQGCHNNSNGDAVSPEYHPWLLHQAKPDDTTTACFWTTFDGSVVRRSGGKNLPRAVTLRGACNATRFDGFAYGGVVDGIVIEVEPGKTTLANGVSCEGMWIEGVTGKAVRVIGPGQGFTASLVVGGNRVEAVNIYLSLEGASRNNYNITKLYQGGDIGPDVVTLLNNPNNLIVDLDFHNEVVSERSHRVTGFGHIFQALHTKYDVLELRAGNVGSGLSLRSAAGVLHAFWRYVASGIAELGGNPAEGTNLALTSVAGLSGTGVRSLNLRGQTRLDRNGSASVRFPKREADANYQVMVSLMAAEAAPVAWRDPRPDGFSVAGPPGAVVCWMLIR